MNNWEDIFKDRLESYEMEVKPESFAAVEAGLDTPRATRGGARWLLWLAAAAAAACAVLFLGKPGSAPQAAHEQLVAEAVTLAEPEPLEPAEPAEAPLEGIRPNKGRMPSSRPAANKEDVVEVLDIPARYVAEAVTEDKPDETKPTPTTRQDEVQPTGTSSPATEDLLFQDWPEIETEGVSNTKRKVSIGLSGAAGGGHSAFFVTNDLSLPLSNSVQDHVSPVKSQNYYNNRTYSDALVNLASGQHHRPLTAGISIRFPLAGDWSLISGLEYSSYRSSFATGCTLMHQTAQYIGVPVRLDYSWLHDPRWDLYTGLGMQVDWNIGAKLGQTAIDKDGASVSLVAAGGLQYNITKHLGLYIEPHVSWLASYYLGLQPNTGHLETFRTQNPLMLNASCGLRFSL